MISYEVKSNMFIKLCEFMLEGKGADTVIKRLVRMICIVPFSIIAMVCLFLYMIYRICASPFIYLFTGVNIFKNKNGFI